MQLAPVTTDPLLGFSRGPTNPCPGGLGAATGRSLTAGRWTEGGGRGYDVYDGYDAVLGVVGVLIAPSPDSTPLCFGIVSIVIVVLVVL